MNFGHIRNPLTVIAIFAGATELGGTYVLPYVTDASNQRLYIWFLMVFPTYLISLFFLMLWHKHVHLYAPSDYSDENNFVAAGAQTLREKFKEEVVEATSSESSEVPTQSEPTNVQSPEYQTSDIETDPVKLGHKEFAHRYFFAEEYALSRLAAELGVTFKRKVSPTNLRNVMFDAVKVDGDGTTVVEVKYTQTGAPNLYSYVKAFKNAKAYYDTLGEQNRAKFKMIFVIVFDLVDQKRIEKTTSALRAAAQGYEFPIDVRFYELGSEADYWFSKEL